MTRAGVAAACLLFASALAARALGADDAIDATAILEQRPHTEVELVQTRITAFDQTGYGYQSQAGPPLGPGSETLHVLEGQAEFVMRQGELTHRVWVPVDVVTSASANAIDTYAPTPDIVSTASAQNVAKEVQYELQARTGDETTWTGGAGFHHEENFLSWSLALGYRRSLADDNATLDLALNQVLDWFDAFAVGGKRAGRVSRSSTNLNAGFSQLLSPSTLAAVSYGVTLQRGELSNTWNTVPTLDGARMRERLPRGRDRHAVSFEVSQFLPWHAALRVRYRFYGDDWDASAHSVEAALRQRLAAWLVLGATYRFHDQTGVSFFTTQSPRSAIYASADSDLGPFTAQTIGGDATVSLPTARFGTLFLSFGYDRYFRSDDLRLNVATWASGFRF